MFNILAFYDELKERLMNKDINFFRSLLVEALEVLKEEPILLSLNETPSFVVGDTHGDLTSTLTAIKKTKDAGDRQQLIFLGDYVDRSENDIVNFHVVLKIKKEEPKRVFLLRGNHETPEINLRYGFQKNLLLNNLDELIPLYHQVMGELPLAAQMGNVLMVHGGLAKEGSLEKIRASEKQVSPNDPLTLQLLWNDPEDSIKGFERNIFRGSDVLMFGSEAFQLFMDENSLNYLIRSHVPYERGYKWFFNEKLLSIFTCNQEPYYKPRVIAETDGKNRPRPVCLE